MDNTKENLLPELKLSPIAIPFGIIQVVLIIILLLFLFNQGLSLPKPSTSAKTNNEITSDVFIVLTFLLIAGALLFVLLPNFKENIHKFLEQITQSIFVFIYTICFIIFFLTIPSKFLDKYGFIITPVTILLTAFMFYKGTATNYIEQFNINYERIKCIILFLCLITIFIVYYSVDPGGYIKKYFGSSLLLTILLSVFALLYLIIMLTLPDTIKPVDSKSSSNNFLDNFSKFSVYGSILFIIFLIIITVGIYKFPGGLLNNKQVSVVVIVLLLMIITIWGVGLVSTVFPEISDKTMNVSKASTFKKSLLTLLGIIISGLLIAWLVYYLQNLSGQSGIISFILNLSLVLVVLSLIYKTIHVELPGAANSKKDNFFNLILNLILYIPCIFSGILDSIVKHASTMKNAAAAADSKPAAPTTTSSIILLVLSIVLLAGYIFLPYFMRLITLQGGKLLVNKPVYTDSLYTLASYEDLNGSNDFEYTYGLSFWLFINANPTKASSNEYVSLLNYGNKPNILYKASTNTLMITMEQKGLTKQNSKLIDFDENNNRIIYKKSDILLQKWNNIVINYSGGTLDIFFNNELVKSAIEVVPYMTLDSLTIGSDNGVDGGICNVVYFKEPLTVSKMYIMYNMVKDKTLPITSEMNKTIIKY
jgi:hypothetical protein